VALLVLVARVLRQERHRAVRDAIVADPVRTPGVLNLDVTEAMIGTAICTRGWTRTVRPPIDYTNALKLKQMRECGETGPPSGYQEDHLISLELGDDPSDPRNLWPEPYPRATQVDLVENGNVTMFTARARPSRPPPSPSPAAAGPQATSEAPAASSGAGHHLALLVAVLALVTVAFVGSAIVGRTQRRRDAAF